MARTQRTHLVAVYGSLRRGQSNHYLLEAATYVGTYRTLPRYEMWDLGAFPALVTRLRDGCSAVVEVYRVTDATLAALDRLESNGRFYGRKQVRLVADAGPGVTAWLYVLLGVDHYRPRAIVASGDWVQYLAGGALHA